MLDHFLHDDSTEMRLARSIVQGLLSVAIVTVPFLFGSLIKDATVASIATAAIMCVLSPLMALCKTGNPEEGTVDVTDKGEGGEE